MGTLEDDRVKLNRHSTLQTSKVIQGTIGGCDYLTRGLTLLQD